MTSMSSRLREALPPRRRPKPAKRASPRRRSKQGCKSVVAGNRHCRSVAQKLAAELTQIKSQAAPWVKLAHPFC